MPEEKGHGAQDGYRNAGKDIVASLKRVGGGVATVRAEASGRKQKAHTAQVSLGIPVEFSACSLKAELLGETHLAP